MYVIIAGCGVIGAQLANNLSKAKHNVVIIDQLTSAFELLDPMFNGTTLWGNAIDVDILEQAGISEADAFVAVTSNDNLNLLATQIARKIFKVNHVVALNSGAVRKAIAEDFGIQIVSSLSLVTERVLTSLGGREK